LPGRPCILVIDDEDAVRHFTVRVLREAGYQVLELAEAESALLIFRATDFDCAVVVSDVKMDGLSGTALASALAALRPTLPVLLVSACADLRVTPMPATARRDFLQKPFSPDQLLSAVQGLLADHALPA
jgi:FixJ family two-component response regulator